MPDASALTRAESLITSIPDYPKPGIMFRDITPLLTDAAALRTVVEALVEPFEGRFDAVAGVEARGFLLAGAAAIVANVGLMPIRKAGKLPRPAASVEYDLEYGTDKLEIHRDAIHPGERILIVDDVLATGGTAAATCRLVETLSGHVVGVGVLIELEALGGRARLGERRVESLVRL